MESVKDLLKERQVFTIQSGATIKETVDYMASKGIGLLPVLKDGKLVGVFSERDLVKRVIAENKDLNSTLIDDVMSKNLIVAKIDETNEALLAKMTEAKTRHILIIENDKLVGVLSLRDLLAMDLHHFKSTVEVLHNYIYSK
jgi:CBS domain-containing protein